MKNLNILLLITVLGGTIGLFFLLGPEEKSPLFYFNLGFTCLLEIILLTTVIKFSGERLFNVPGLAVAIQIKRYVLLTAIIMIGFNIAYTLLGHDLIDPKWYFGALILLVIIYSLIIIFTIQGASFQQKHTQVVKEQTEKRQDFKAQAVKSNNLFVRVAAKSPFDNYNETEACKQAVRVLTDKISSIPVGVLDRKAASFESIAIDINGVHDLIKKLEDTSEEDAYNSLLKSIAEKAYDIAEDINAVTKV